MREVPGLVPIERIGQDDTKEGGKDDRTIKVRYSRNDSFNKINEENLLQLFDHDKFIKDYEEKCEEDEKKTIAIKKKLEIVHSQIVKLSSGLLAHSVEDNIAKRAAIEKKLESNVLSPNEERRLVNKIKQLRAELSYSDVVSDITYHNLIKQI